MTRRTVTLSDGREVFAAICEKCGAEVDDLQIGSRRGPRQATYHCRECDHDGALSERQIYEALEPDRLRKRLQEVRERGW